MITFLIVTHVAHIEKDGLYFAYAPYVREMNIWLKYVDEVIVVAPKTDEKISKIDEVYNHPKVKFVEIDSFDVKSSKSILKSLISIPKNLITISRQIKKANHIHLRCPGNIGFLGVLAQILFPSKIKTAKYAGNWDLEASKPFTYKLQQKILLNTFLTKNMQVLVYGDWKNNTKNIKSFFTATYKEEEKLPLIQKGIDGIFKFVFVGMLTKGKQPLYAVKIIERLKQLNFNVQLSVYGEGVERLSLEQYIQENNLFENIFLKGNQDLETLKEAYQESHFVVLPSVSEGWPKAIAEGMFWGCVPIATKVSCVPYMLDHGSRGILLDLNLDQDIMQIKEVIQNNDNYFVMQKNASNWSQKYTTNYFESEIKLLLRT